MSETIVDLREPELVEIQVGLGGKVWINVNGICRFRVYAAKKLHVEVPNGVITIEQKPPVRRKLTPKEKKQEEWEMDNLMPKQEHDEIMREVLGKEEGEPLE